MVPDRAPIFDFDLANARRQLQYQRVNGREVWCAHPKGDAENAIAKWPPGEALVKT